MKHSTRTTEISCDKLDKAKPLGTKEETKTYLLSTSVKGIPRVLKGRTLLHKTIWLMAVILGCGIGTFQVSELVHDYLNYNVTSTMSIATDYSTFPDITLCSLGVSNEQDIFHEYLADVRTMYDNMATIPTLQWVQGYMSSPQAFIQNRDSYIEGGGSPYQKQMIVECVWQSDSIGFIKCNGSAFHKYRFNTRYSICIKITLPEAEKDSSINNADSVSQWTGILYLGDFINSTITRYNIEPIPMFSTGIIAFIHPPGSLPSEGIIVSPGTYSTIDVSAHRWRHLSQPYSDCKSIYEDHEDSEYAIIMSSLLTGGQKYSKAVCENIYYQSLCISQCNCLTTKYYASPKQRQNYSMCVNLESNLNLLLGRISCSTAYIRQINEEHLKKICPEQCEEVTYTNTLSQVRCTCFNSLSLSLSLSPGHHWSIALRKKWSQNGSTPGTV